MSAQKYYNQHPDQGSSYRGQPQSNMHAGPQQMNGQQDKGVFSTLVGAGVGGYAGSKLTHNSTLGKLAGGLIGGYALRHGVPGMSSHKKHGHSGYGGHGGHGHHGGPQGHHGGPGGPGGW